MLSDINMETRKFYFLKSFLVVSQPRKIVFLCREGFINDEAVPTDNICLLNRI